MKIAIVADPIDEQYAGIYVYAKEFIEALERNNPGHEIVYIHLKPNAFFDGKREKIIPLHRKLPLWATVRKFFWIPWLLRHEHFDLVHDLSHIAPFTFWGGPYKKVITIHDLTPVLFPEWHIRASRIVHKLIFPFIFRRADLVLCDSEHTQQDILAHYRVRGQIETALLAARSSVKPMLRQHALSILKDKYQLSGDFILYVGTLEPRKNLGLIVDMFEQLQTQGKFNGKLVLVGKSGWFLQHFESRLAAMPAQVRANIVLTGYVPEADLSVFYSAATLFVYPSFYEGFGLPPLEAMRCGCPVLVANNSSLPEVVGNSDMLLPTTDVNAWVTAAAQVLQDQAFHAKLAQFGLLQAARFNWDSHVRQVLQWYENS